MTVPTLTMNNGRTIPQLGFGVFQVEPEETEDVVKRALEVGYRHIDTAQMYHNEEGVGAALQASGVAREDVFVTSKLDNQFHRPDDARRSFEESLHRLGTNHVDLFLIHWPVPTQYDGDFVTTWNTLVEFFHEGRALSVGVSNFQPAHLDRLAKESGLAPAVNQVEVHPFFANAAVRQADAAAGILTEAWSPIARGKVGEDPTICGIADRLERTPAQVALRWHVQRSDVVFPKSTHSERMRENFAIFDFELTADDMAAIDGLDRGAEGRMGPDPDTFDWVG